MSNVNLNTSVTSLVFPILFRTEENYWKQLVSQVFSLRLPGWTTCWQLFSHFLGGSSALTCFLCNCLVCGIGIHVYCQNIIFATVAPAKAYLHTCKYNRKPRRERHANVRFPWRNSVPTSRALFIGRAVQQLQHSLLFSEEGKLRA